MVRCQYRIASRAQCCDGVPGPLKWNFQIGGVVVKLEKKLFWADFRSAQVFDCCVLGAHSRSFVPGCLLITRAPVYARRPAKQAVPARKLSDVLACP
jgi:hypothetical protein